jgi:hypothetical protein
MRFRKMHNFAVLALMTGSLFSPSLARANYITGFEAPTFSPGSLNGQDGWVVQGPTGLSMVENSFAESAAQAVRIDASGNNTNGGAFRPMSVGLSDGRIATFSVDQYFTTSTTATQRQTFFVYTPAAALIAEVGQRFTGQATLATGSGFEFFPGPSLDAWHNWTVRLDFVTQTVTFLLDGSVIAANRPFGTASNTVGLSGFLYVNPGNDQRFVDNFSVTSVPEASSLSMLAIGVAGLLGRRRFPFARFRG